MDSTITTDTTEIAAAGDALRVGRVRREELAAAVEDAAEARAAIGTRGPGYRAADRAYSRALAALDTFAQFDLDYLRRNVEMAVRAANPGAPEALIVSTARNL